MDDTVKLQVGEQQFLTTRGTLVGESTYFASLFSDRWNNQEGDDGSIFIDSDPALFAEILRYLRSGNFPLFFDTGSHMYDYAKYTALLGEAQYFGIPKLEGWIRKQGYLDAVKIDYGIDVVENVDHRRSWSTTADRRLKFSLVPWILKTYRCPRGISVHEGRPDRCGRQCIATRGENEPEYDETQVFTSIAVKTQYIFNPEACLGARVDTEMDESPVDENLDSKPGRYETEPGV
ncbi:hypothetical protein F5B22DRAFT_643545 [Xylaria bambusicola]|uniref:uncharacterized protein n=1 Tax=Xylaria bambusicola TaxID=326684 RepID=UPI002008D0D1|nr:uncharacterized protein F5B22DRAFT_643545 [Xylaria bambusicola]KAI0521963.1 hypothetical protein F5B22DRAFT_643545 [Xylaria bambusicola]